MFYTEFDLEQLRILLFVWSMMIITTIIFSLLTRQPSAPRVIQILKVM